MCDVSIVAFAGSCPQLKSVNFYYCQLLTDASIAALAGNCPLLKSVDLTRCMLLTDASIAALKAALPDACIKFASWASEMEEVD